MIEITSSVGISEHELSFTFDRSPGPGGQKVNKVNTRVTLNFSITASRSLSQQQKKILCQGLASRINSDGVMRISSSKERTQLANRRTALNRFIELLAQAFDLPKPRKATRPPAAAHARRLDIKKQHGILKQARAVKISADD